MGPLAPRNRYNPGYDSKSCADNESAYMRHICDASMRSGRSKMTANLHESPKSQHKESRHVNDTAKKKHVYSISRIEQ
jgi:hypothetical protein